MSEENNRILKPLIGTMNYVFVNQALIAKDLRIQALTQERDGLQEKVKEYQNYWSNVTKLLEKNKELSDRMELMRKLLIEASGFLKVLDRKGKFEAVDDILRMIEEALSSGAVEQKPCMGLYDHVDITYSGKCSRCGKPSPDGEAP